MHVIDLRTADAPLEIDADVCIVGSGPAGLTVAAELRHSGLSIVIMESGGLDAEVTTLRSAETSSPGRVPDAVRPALNRIFGGTSHSWAGRCIPFDAIDYEERSWVPGSGWPLTEAGMAPYVRRAAGHLRLDPDWLAKPPRPQPGPPLDAALVTDTTWQFSNDDTTAGAFMLFGPRFLQSLPRNVTALVHATATQVVTNADGTRAVAVEAANPEGRQATVRAGAILLAAGGIENARLLLNSDRTAPAGVGNAHDVVGRYLMDHPRIGLGDFDLAQARPVWERFGYYWAETPAGPHMFIDGARLPARQQREEGLLNCAAWVDDVVAGDDPLDAAKRLLKRQSAGLAQDVRTVLSQPGLVARAIQDRLVHKRTTLHKMDRLTWMCLVEQTPDAESRLLLTPRRDALGARAVDIRWRVGELERLSALKLALATQTEFRRIGLPPPVLPDWVRGHRLDEAEFHDAAHPIGTTRMATDPRRGVVDADCAVHGVAGLYVSGSSVFPTASHANPTMMIVALAVRLADHLKARPRAG